MGELKKCISLKQKTMQYILACLMSFYHRVEQMNLMSVLRIRGKDVYCVAILVDTLEELADDEDSVLLICRVLMVPMILSIHPDTRDISTEKFQELL